MKALFIHSCCVYISFVDQKAEGFVTSRFMEVLMGYGGFPQRFSRMESKSFTCRDCLFMYIRLLSCVSAR